MKESLELKITIGVKPNKIYEAWLDSALHSKMTGGYAECGKEIGESFTAWDGYISGKNIHLIPNQEIVQSWRTTDFKESDEDSYLKILLRELKSGTELTFIHNNIPEGQNQYEQGWKEYYFDPMIEFFEGIKKNRTDH